VLLKHQEQQNSYFQVETSPRVLFHLKNSLIAIFHFKNRFVVNVDLNPDLKLCKNINNVLLEHQKRQYSYFSG